MKAKLYIETQKTCFQEADFLFWFDMNFDFEVYFSILFRYNELSLMIANFQRYAR
jgi:hypothetical protein